MSRSNRLTQKVWDKLPIETKYMIWRNDYKAYGIYYLKDVKIDVDTLTKYGENTSYVTPEFTDVYFTGMKIVGFQRILGYTQDEWDELPVKQQVKDFTLALEFPHVGLLDHIKHDTERLMEMVSFQEKVSVKKKEYFALLNEVYIREFEMTTQKQWDKLPLDNKKMIIKKVPDIENKHLLIEEHLVKELKEQRARCNRRG